MAEGEMAAQKADSEFPYRILLICLIASAILLLFSLCWGLFSKKELPKLDYVPGYYQKSKTVGIMRIIPLSGAAFSSPAVSDINKSKIPSPVAEVEE